MYYISDGLIVITTDPTHFTKVAKYIDILRALMIQKETEGKWSKLKEEIFPNYYKTKDGVIIIFRVH